jgi:PEP-CTERM motif
MTTIMIRLFITALAVSAFPATTAGAPIWNIGNECPTDAQMAAYARQYYVSEATHCVFDAAVGNITGTNAEALLYLNSPPAPEIWGTDWVGLGQEGEENDIVGINFTFDAGNDDGMFFINTALLNYAQFAIGIKDGEDPKWAIFLLPEGVASGNWGFATEQGSLSHFTAYARGVSTPPPTVTPEPASLLLLGTGLGLAARRMRKRTVKG